MRVLMFMYGGMVNRHPDPCHNWDSRLKIAAGEICLQVGDGFLIEDKYIIPVFLSSGHFAYAICAGKIGWEMWTQKL